jgi:putative redox protein
MHTLTTWKSGQSFESTYHTHTIQLDGEGKAYSPKAALLSALASCTGIDVVLILGKMKVDFTSLEIAVDAEQTEEHPRVFKSFNMAYRVGTDKANEEKVSKAVHLSYEKYCGISAMLQKHAPINISIHIQEP